MFALFTLFVIVSIGFTAACGVILAIRRQSARWLWIPVATVGIQLVLPDLPAIKIGGNAVPTDFGLLLILPLIAFALIRTPLERTTLWLLLLPALATLSLIRGLEAGSGKTAFLYIRNGLTFSLFLLAGRLLWPGIRALDPLVRPVGLLAGVLTVAALARWAGLQSLPNADSLVSEGGTLRALTSEGALILLITVWLISSTATLTGQLRALGFWGGIGMVVILQHRSVWMAGMGSCACWWLFSQRRLRDLRLPLIPLLGAILALPVILWALSSTHLGQAITTSWERMSLSSGTGGGRLQQNAGFIDMMLNRSWIDIAVGVPAGTSMERWGGDRIITYAAHNAYLQAWFDLGLIGMGTMILIMGTVLVQAWRLRHSDPRLAGGILAIATAIAIYWFPYSYSPFQGFILGSLLGILAAPPKPLLLSPPAA